MTRESREVWAQRVEDWLDSGLTCAQYAAKCGLNEHTLSNWRGKLRRAAKQGGDAVNRRGDRARRATAECETPKFVELAAVAEQDSRVELELPNGCRIRFSASVDAHAVGSLVGVLLRQVRS